MTFGTVLVHLMATVLLCWLLSSTARQARGWIRAAWATRRIARRNIHADSEGSLHAVPIGEVHDDSTSCSCQPRAVTSGATLLVDHRSLRDVRAHGGAL